MSVIAVLFRAPFATQGSLLTDWRRTLAIYYAAACAIPPSPTNTTGSLTATPLCLSRPRCVGSVNVRALDLGVSENTRLFVTAQGTSNACSVLLLWPAKALGTTSVSRMNAKVASISLATASTTTTLTTPKDISSTTRAPCLRKKNWQRC